MNNALEGINSRIAKAEEAVSDLEDRNHCGNHCHKMEHRKKMNRNEGSLRYLWDNIKHTNIHFIGVPEGEEREKGSEKIYEEIIAENFTNKGN